MFTGLIERTGRVKSAARARGATVIEIEAGPGFEVSPGDSVAIDGLCLTAVSAQGGILRFEASPESLSRSTLKDLKPGSRVNLERALKLGDRLGGHMVTGHVDAAGKIMDSKSQGGFTAVTVSAPPEVMELLAPKGSVALDGISLTINEVSAGAFKVMVIPETLKRTTLGDKRPGQAVNLETDLIAKYVARLMGGGGDLYSKLAEEGFV